MAAVLGIVLFSLLFAHTLTLILFSCTILYTTMQKNPTKDILEAIEKASEDLRQLSLIIHDNPEIGYQETLAHKTLTDYLVKQGFHVTKSACGIETAFIAEYVQLGGEHQHQSKDLDTSAPLRSVGFCSEFDALPEPVGHGCGHNLIAIAGVAAALGLKRSLEKNRIRGKVRLLGTPAEGKWAMRSCLIE